MHSRGVVSSGYSSDSVPTVAARPWSSTDSHGSLDVPSRMHMQKAGSFGGVPSVYRQAAVEHPPTRPPPRRSNTGERSKRVFTGCCCWIAESRHRPSETSPASSVDRQPSIPETGSMAYYAGQPVYLTMAPLEHHLPHGTYLIDPRYGGSTLYYSNLHLQPNCTNSVDHYL